MAAAALALTIALFAVVIVPAVDRGGVAELVGIVVIFVAVLFVERWLRTR